MTNDIYRIIKTKNAGLYLFAFNMRWHAELMREVLLRYKIFFIFLVALLAPSLSALKQLFIEPLRIFFDYQVSNPTVLIITLALYQIFALVWLMLHGMVFLKQPWKKYLLSLEISHRQNLFTDVSMMLCVDAIMWLPLIFASVSAMSESIYSALLVLLILVKTIYLIALTIFVQVSWGKHRLMFAALMANIVTIICMIYLAAILQIAIFLVLTPLLYFLLLMLSKSEKNKAKQEKKIVIIGNSYNKPNALFAIITKQLIDNISQISLIIAGLLILLVLSISVLMAGVDESRLLSLMTIIVYLNTWCVSNLFKHIEMQWQKYDGYLLSLSIKRSTLFVNHFFISFLLVAVFDLIVLVPTAYLSGYFFTAQLLKPILMSLVYLAASYYPQVKYTRYGLFVAFCLMVLFVLFNLIFMNYTG